MDFTKFSEENFDLKKWINGTFVAQKETNQNAEVESSSLFYFSEYSYNFLFANFI